MEMLFCGVMETDLKMLEQNLKKLVIQPNQRKEFDKVMADVYQVLDQNGYEKCTEVIKRMFTE